MTESRPHPPNGKIRAESEDIPGAEQVAVSSNILVAEDDKFVRQLVVAILIRAGYTVFTATNGEEAWDTLRSRSFDLLITDHDMPKLLGLDLIRRLRAHTVWLPAILMSGNMPRDVSDFQALVPRESELEKPLTVADLLSRVGELLNHRFLPESQGVFRREDS